MLDKLYNLDANFAVNVGIHSLILFSFLTAFFMLYISQVSRSTLEKELKENIHNALALQIQQLPTDIKEFVNKLPYDQLLLLYSEPEKAKEVNNKWLFKVVILMNVLLWCFMVFTVILLKNACGFDIHVGHIIIENAIAFTCIGFVEYLFFTNIALKFAPAEPSLISKEFLTSFKNSI